MSRFFDGLKNLLSTLPNTRNATASNQIVSTWLDPSQLRQIYKTGLGNKIIRVKSGYALKNDMYFSDEQDKAFYQAKLAKHVKLATTFMLAFGRGIILINENGKDLSLPMTGKPDVYKLDVFSGDMVTAQGASIDLMDKRYMKPKFYNVRGANFHHSRVVDFKYVIPPELEAPIYQYGGISEFELIHSQLVNDGVVERASATIIDKNSSFFYKIKGFKEILSSGKEADILKFYQMTENARSIFGAGLIDSEDDVLSVSQTLTDLDKVDQITLRRLAMVTGIPLAILVGENVKGLNSTGKNEKQAFNEMIDMLQRDYIFDPLNELLNKLGKGEADFLENQNVTALEKIEFETKALDNALKLQTLGEDYGSYLSNLGITEKDNFEEMFGEIGNADS